MVPIEYSLTPNALRPITSHSGHDANLIFFNKKNKDWMSRTLANPQPPTSDNISFSPYPPTTYP